MTVGAAVAALTAGNTSSFGSHCSATGGAVQTSSTNGGEGGVGTGGDVNIWGGGGAFVAGASSGAGGASYFGGGQHGCSAGFLTNTAARLAFGAGGIGVYNGHTQGANDVGGLVIVHEYA